MVKRSIILILLLSIISTIKGNLTFEVVSFEEDLFDSTASIYKLLDGEGEAAAVLKIQIPMLSDAIISTPNPVGPTEYKPGEIIQYMTAGSKEVTIKHPDFEPLTYRFPKILEGERTYIMVLRVPESYKAKPDITVKFTTNVSNASLEINGETLTSNNGEFVLKLEKGEYPYKITTTKSGFSPASGIINITENDIKEKSLLSEYVELPSQKKSNLQLLVNKDAKVKIDNKDFNPAKEKNIKLSMGTHHVYVNYMGYSKTDTVELSKENEIRDLDISVPFTIAYPSSAEFTVIPKEGALKPKSSKLKAGDFVRLLGKYDIEVKAKDYDNLTLPVEIFPTSENNIKKVVALPSKASQLYYGKDGIAQNRKKAVKMYENAIKKGDETAMWEYGRILLDENSGSQVGRSMILLAADKGYPEAEIYAAEFFNLDDAKTEKYLREASKYGDQTKSNLLLGKLYKKNNKYEAALNEFSKSNNLESLIQMGEVFVADPDLYSSRYAYVIDGLNNLQEDSPYYSLSRKVLGELAFDGIGVNKNTEVATEYWEKIPANLLTQEQLLILAAKYLNNSENARKYLTQLDFENLNQDYIVYGDISLIDILKNHANQLRKNKDEIQTAFKCLLTAYNLGDRSNLVVAQLGKAYKDGEGVEKNPAKAKELLKFAIDQYNDPMACRWLGLIYETENDMAKAEQYYLKGVKAGDLYSKGYYGTILSKKGSKYFDEAVKYWLEAANGGHKQSMKNLVIYYEKVKPDKKKAAYWKSKQQ